MNQYDAMYWGPTYLGSLHFMLYSIQSWLMPLSLGIEDLDLAPPDKDSFPHLPGEAVPGAGSDLGPVHGYLPSLCSVLILDHKGCNCSCAKSRKVFLASGVKIS